MAVTQGMTVKTTVKARGDPLPDTRSRWNQWGGEPPSIVEILASSSFDVRGFSPCAPPSRGKEAGERPDPRLWSERA
jgi:hypothetical protein